MIQRRVSKARRAGRPQVDDGTRSPYRGLIPYTEADSFFFFGRERECDIVASNLAAARLTLFYGPSGVGKTSVLRAGVVHDLRDAARDEFASRGATEHAVVFFASWRDDPVVLLQSRIHEQLSAMIGPQAESALLEGGDLCKLLRAWSKHLGGSVLVILDQFEEYFLYHERDDGAGGFAQEFIRAANDPDLRVHFLLSMRDDAIANLDRFKGQISHLFDNYLRIEHLSESAAREAIEKPLEAFNNRLPQGETQYSIQPALVDAVIETVGRGQVILGDAGQGSIRRNGQRSGIETPYLQLVMTRLWNEELPSGSRTLRLQTLDRLKGGAYIIRTHLDETMGSLPRKERDAAARVFRYLVTPSGTKIAMTVTDLAEYAGFRKNSLTPMLERLSGGGVRILRSIPAPSDDAAAPPRFEIFHDALATAILDWRGRYVRDQERREAAKKLRAQRELARKKTEQVAKMRRLMRDNREAKAAAVEQEKLASRRLSALEKAVAAIPDEPLRAKFGKYLVSGQRPLRPDGGQTRKGSRSSTGARARSLEKSGLNLWPNGSTLRIGFLDGAPALHKRVLRVALEWLQYANLRFVPSSARNAQIRISFKDSGAWSYVGTEALALPSNEATMNFGWLTMSTSEVEFRRVVLRQFGHALGLITETNNPNAMIPWNKPALYRHFEKQQGWTKQEVNEQILWKARVKNYREFDRHSIMMNPIEKGLALRNFSVGDNTELSQSDKEFIRSLYPGRPETRSRSKAR